MNRCMSAAVLFALLVPSMAIDGHNIRGKVTKIQRARTEDQGRMIGMVMVEADEKQATVDKANLIVTSKTSIFEMRGEERVPATFEDLKVGATVTARFVEGPTIMIYPLQVAASEIVILNSDDAKGHKVVVRLKLGVIEDGPLQFDVKFGPWRPATQALPIDAGGQTVFVALPSGDLKL
jgi:hypothetical protein